MVAPPVITALVLDAGPVIANTNLPQASTYYTTPSVLAELKDEAARNRLQSLYHLQTRVPQKQSMDFVRGFARKTGDAEVLSTADIGIIALTYELECELNAGDWRLKNAPGQARINGAPPVRVAADAIAPTLAALDLSGDAAPDEPAHADASHSLAVHHDPQAQEAPETPREEEPEIASSDDEGEHVDDNDDGEWITPANIKTHRGKDAHVDATAQEVKTMKVACATHDFAIQNVLLQIGLNLVSGDGKRITSVKTWVMRCHACFKVTRKMDTKFCPSCGGATLMRTSVSTDSQGAMKIHLKRNMQWNNRGTVYSIPKQQHGTANMKGRDNLILRADQREVEKLEKRDRYRKEIDLLDPDTIPSIVSGRRDAHASAVRYGHGKRNPNANRKR